MFLSARNFSRHFILLADRFPSSGTPGKKAEWRKFPLICVGLLLAILSLATASTFAQVPAAANAPLNFGNNYFVRGDYVVAGAQGMMTNFDSVNALAIGTITVPDPNPGIKPSGITGTNAVPPGAEVVAAVLYWQTVEKIAVLLGHPGSGQNGFFRPLITGGPKAPGYPISGVQLGGNNTVSWSSGGCTTGSTGKTVRTYRANVLGALPRDASGNISANGQYEVRLPGTGSTTPIAVGATLVLVYRILDPTVPLNAIVFYDGDTATSATSMTMTQTMQGFYDAAHNPISRLTHIVGNAKAKKTETVSFNGQVLPSLYANLSEPPFPGFYGAWDNPTWTFDPNKTYVNMFNPVTEDSASVTTQVAASGNNPGCVGWGAVIFATTVKNSDSDGLLDVWKTNQGYCDAVAVDAGKCSRTGDPGWVDLPNAAMPGQGMKDVYIQLDYLCSSPNPDGNTCQTGDGVNYSFDPRPSGAIDLVKAKYGAHNITLHINETVPNRPNVADFHAIPEGYCQDTVVSGKASLCAFPNPPGTSINRGVVSWPGGFYALKTQLVDLDEPLNLIDCATGVEPTDCVPRFQPGAAPSKHEVIFAHAVGQPRWKFPGGTLVSAVQTGNTVTFTTSTAVGTLNVLGTDANGHPIFDPSCANGRVTIIGGATNANLNGTYCVNSFFNPQGTTLAINVGGSPLSVSYTLFTDPNLAVVPGFTNTASGAADVGGANLLVTLGLWGNPAFNGQNAFTSPPSDGQKPLVIAGTFMHESGHGVGSLAHGGPAALVAQNQQSIQSVLTNCKPNYFSVMSYSRQVDGVLDYSGTTLGDLNKTNQSGDLTGAGSAIASWYVPWPALSDANGKPIGSPAKLSCPGGPIPALEPPMTRVTAPANTFSFVAAPDANYDGIPSEDLQGACDWCDIDLAQTDATGAISSSSGGQFNGGGGQFNGGGGQFNGGGGQFNGGGGQFNGGGGQFNGGGGQFNGGGGQFNGGGEIDVATVNSITHSPQNLAITSEAASPRTITLQWVAPFGQIGAYNVYRSAAPSNAFTRIATVSGNPPVTTFTDTVTCNPAGYKYFVTAVLSNTSTNPGQESTPSNTVSTIPPITDPVTGCYTFAGFSSPAAGSSPLQGSLVPITWTILDDFYTTSAIVSNLTANTLVAIGPISNDVSCGLVTGSTPRTTVSASGTGMSFLSNQFSFKWDTSRGFNGTAAAFPPGCYRVELDLDSGQPTFGGQPASAFQVQIYLSDVNESVLVTTTSLPNAFEGVPYNQTLQENGGVPPLAWTILPGSVMPGGASTLPGLSLDPNTGNLSGTPTTPGIYTFTVQVTDSIGDFGTQMLTLIVDAVVANTNDAGAGSLRQALLDVDAQSASQPIPIVFMIPGAGVQTIAPASPLPPLTQPAILDGTTQPGYAGTPIIELNGSNAGVSTVSGLHIAAGNSTVRGLAIHSFSGNGILIDTKGADVIQGNYVGTDVTGTLASPNGANGIQIIAVPNNTVGGAATTMRNIISGNTGESVRIDGTLATGNVVRGNYIGTDVSGSNAVGNNASGVYIRRAPGNSVIGNVISGNAGFAGITICGFPNFCGGGDIPGIDDTSNASGNIIQGNLVGTDSSGTVALGNSQAGLSIDGAPNTVVGGTTSGTANTISFNGTNDVQIFDVGAVGNQIRGNTIQGSTAANTVGINVLTAGLTGNTFSQNSISGHQGLGIDLAPPGVNQNPLDGANNFPVIVSATLANGTINATLNSTANAMFTIEFFSNRACNASLFGEGAVFLGSLSVQTDESGNAAFAFMAVGLVAGNTITATSTDASGTTSEFSACVPVS